MTCSIAPTMGHTIWTSTIKECRNNRIPRSSGTGPKPNNPKSLSSRAWAKKISIGMLLSLKWNKNTPENKVKMLSVKVLSGVMMAIKRFSNQKIQIKEVFRLQTKLTLYHKIKILKRIIISLNWKMFRTRLKDKLKIKILTKGILKNNILLSKNYLTLF